MKKQTRNTKRWRRKHPVKWNAQKARNYNKTSNAPNSNLKWCDWEIEMILEHSISDRELSKKLGRSVQSIQIKRCRINKLNGKQGSDNGLIR